MMVAGALTMLLLSSPARSQPTWASRTDAATNGTTAPGAQHVRQVIVGVVENVDVRRWESLRDVFAESVFVDYTSLFGGSARNYTAAELVDNWRQLLESFSMTRHVLGPIVVDGNEAEVQARCPVRIYHFLRDAPGGQEWVVVGQFVFTLAKESGTWRIQRIVLDVQSQEGNTNLLVEALLAADKRSSCPKCVVGK